MSDYVNPLTDYSPQMESAEPRYARSFGERSATSVFSEDDELELASELLEVTSEAEFDDFVRGLIGRAGWVLHEPVEPSLENDIGDILKGIAKVALPVAGGVLGGMFGGPPGAALGGSLGSAAGRLFGLELEGLSPEDSEFEVSKQFVRFAGATVKNALQGDPSAARSKTVQQAAWKAARAHAPGLMNVAAGAESRNQQRRGAGQSFSQVSEGDRSMQNNDRVQTGATTTARRVGNSGTMNEEEQMDFAARLMEMESEEEFEGYLGDLISRGAQAAGKFISSPTGQALGGALKDVAKQLLPIAGQAVGTYVGGPTGGQIGGALGSAASNLFEAEAETEEREWEAANIFVKVAVDAVNNVANAHPGANPHEVARHAVAEAARHHAPHVAEAMMNGHRDHHAHGHHGHHRHHTGRWVRRGRTIIIEGA
jgi:hypothetical protein